MKIAFCLVIAASIAQTLVPVPQTGSGQPRAKDAKDAGAAQKKATCKIGPDSMRSAAQE